MAKPKVQPVLTGSTDAAVGQIPATSGKSELKGLLDMVAGKQAAWLAKSRRLGESNGVGKLLQIGDLVRRLQASTRADAGFAHDIFWLGFLFADYQRGVKQRTVVRKRVGKQANSRRGWEEAAAELLKANPHDTNAAVVRAAIALDVERRRRIGESPAKLPKRQTLAKSVAKMRAALCIDSVNAENYVH